MKIYKMKDNTDSYTIKKNKLFDLPMRLLLIGKSAIQLSHSSHARTALEQLIAGHPKTSEAQKATQIIKTIKNTTTDSPSSR